MGWFFGCFGGGGKKERKNKTLPSPLKKQQYAAPRCIPAAVSSPIPIKAAPGQERPCCEDLFTVRQVPCSAPLQNIQGAFLQNAVAGCQNQEKLRKPGPWFQLDDLEEELGELRKRIDKESQDTQEIKEEVGIFKSCGSIIKTPSELKCPQRGIHDQGSMPQGGWRPWLAPTVPPYLRNSAANNFQVEGLRAALCEPTPTKECHNLLLNVQTPVSSSKLLQINTHQSTRAQVREQHVSQLVNGDISDTNDELLPRQDGSKVKLLADVSSAKKSFSTSKPCLDNEGKLDGLIQKPKAIFKQGDRSVCSIESNTNVCKDGLEVENNSTKKRRLAVKVASAQPLHALDDDAGSLQEDNALCQKRLRIVSPGEQSKREPNNSSLNTSPVLVEFFRCKSLSPIIESRNSIEASTSYGNSGISEEPSCQLRSYNSLSQVSSQSPSLRQSPASQTKSLTFTSTNNEDNTTNELSYSYGTAETFSEGSYTNSACYNEEEEDGSATASSSTSTDSEETLSDLSPEHCFSPLVNPSHAQSSSLHRNQDNPAIIHGLKASKIHSISSTQYSSYGDGKTQHASRYDSEEEDDTEDDHDLGTDAMSHVSTECSDGEPSRWHGHTESTDSVSGHFTHVGHITSLNLVDTPPKLSEGLATPNIDIPRRAEQQTGRLRSKPASSVLTPVENISQWKQLKERDHRVDVSAKSGNGELCKADLLKSAKRVECPDPGVWDENKNLAWTPLSTSAGKQRTSKWKPESDAKSVIVNASLSHWGTAPMAESIRVDASLSQCNTTTTQTEHVCVDMSLSHWLGPSSKHRGAHKALGTSIISSSSGEGEVVRPAPKVQAKDYISPNSAMQTVKSQFSTPHSTAKYMENQRVRHAASFEQRLEKALDKQGVLLQKKLFATTPAAAVL